MLVLMALAVISVGCGGSVSQADRDYFTAFSSKVDENHNLLDKDSTMVNDTMKFMYAAIDFASPGTAQATTDKTKQVNPEEIAGAIGSIDNAIAELSTDPGLPQPPEDCPECADRNQAIIDARTDTITALRKARAALALGAPLIKARQDEVNEINNIHIPTLLDNTDQASSLYGSIRTAYEKYAAAFQTVSIPPSLEEPRNRLVAKTSAMAAIQQQIIDGYNNWDNAAMERSTDSETQLIQEEQTAYNDLLYPIGKEITNRGEEIGGIGDSLYNLINQFPADVRGAG